MTEAEEASFFSDPGGLGLPTEIAEWLSEKIIMLCPLLGFAAGVGVTVGGLNLQGSVASQQGAQRDPKVALLMVLAGVGIGVLMIGPGCASVKLKLRDYTSQFNTAREAILALTPPKRTELRAEADKLIRLKQKIDDAFAEQPDPRYSA